MTLKVLVVSHTYIEPENQKNLLALRECMEVRAIVPAEYSVLLFRDYRFRPLEGCEDLVRTCTTVRLSRSQYIFLSIRLSPKGFRPDVILVEYNPWSLMFLQAWVYRSIYSRSSKLICFVKKNTYRRYPGVLGALKDWLSRFCMARVDGVVVVSEKAKQMLAERFQRLPPIAVEQHLGVDTDLFSPAGDLGRSSTRANAIVVGYCGRLDADKGVIALINAVREVRQTISVEVVLSLLGSGSLESSISEIAGREEWIKVSPPVPHAEVAAFLRTLDVFVLPSVAMPDHEEHDAHALLEAMACGVACIATQVGVNGEILRGGCGVLVPGSDFAALVDAIRRLVTRPDEREELARAARSIAERRFSLGALAERKTILLKKIAAMGRQESLSII